MEFEIVAFIFVVCLFLLWFTYVEIKGGAMWCKLHQPQANISSIGDYKADEKIRECYTTYWGVMVI